MKLRTSYKIMVLALMIIMLSAGVSIAAPGEPGVPGGGESGGGCGDVFGDLIHVKRDATGQPILAQRWIEMPKELQGYGWGYCPIAVDKAGLEIPFAALSCDPVDPTGTAVVPVDYFGRLSGGRTKERNSRMHFNEVISSIKMAGGVRLDETGRLQLGYTCTSITQCEEWSVIDSPMENMALYTRLMKYGHFQTDPLEVDTWAHGDPAAGIQYHPALDTLDWAKFQPSVQHLLSSDISIFAPESLTAEDFVSAGAALGGAANKTGTITVDLVQYMNRILKITKKTEASEATLNSLPAKVRDCWSSTADPTLELDPVTGEVLPIDPVYDTDCSTTDAGPWLANYELFPDIRERFVDFSAVSYLRPDNLVKVIGPVQITTPQVWLEVENVSLGRWLTLANGPRSGEEYGLDGFITAGSDALRAIEFVHNYAIPVDLGLNFVPDAFKVTIKEKK